MTALVAILGLILGGAGLGALLIRLYGKSQLEAGKMQENNRAQIEADTAKDKADTVLAEHRDPDGVSERLRRGDF